MVELQAIAPGAGHFPIEVGGMVARAEDVGRMTSLSPYQGQKAALSDALKSSHGMAFPAPNRATSKAGARAVWFGREAAMLIGPEPDAGLARFAALTDQSDAWVVVRLEGAGARDVLARLTTVDLRAATFKRGHTARTELQHMMASITRVGPEAFQIMVFRSFARTLAHDLKTAMAGVAARRPA